MRTVTKKEEFENDLLKAKFRMSNIDKDKEEDIPDDAKLRANKDHYPWECISIFREDYLSTIDLVIPNCKHIMALIHVLHKKIHDQDNFKFMKVYKM